MRNIIFLNIKFIKNGIFHIQILIADKEAPLAKVDDSSSNLPGPREGKPRSGSKVRR